ncbi:STAS domain-containing protein [Saccharopolyspora sp. NPDC002578]
MTVTTDRSSNPAEHLRATGPDASFPDTIGPADRATTTSKPGEPRLRLSREVRNVIVVHANGDLDDVGTARLRGLLLPRLSATSTVLVLDLSQITFVGSAALELLINVEHRTRTSGRHLRLAGKPRCLNRALRAGGLTEHFDWYAELAEAISAPISS